MMPEARLKKEIREYVDSLCGTAYWSSIVGGAYAKIGDPDLIVCYRGRYLAVEAKTYDGRQSSWQCLREEQINTAGGRYIIAKSVDDVKNAITEIDKEIENDRK